MGSNSITGNKDEGSIDLRHPACAVLIDLAQQLAQRRDIDSYKITLHDEVGIEYNILVALDEQPGLKVVTNDS